MFHFVCYESRKDESFGFWSFSTTFLFFEMHFLSFLSSSAKVYCSSLYILGRAMLVWAPEATKLQQAQWRLMAKKH